MQPFSLVCYYESYGTEIDFRTQGLAYIFSTNQPFSVSCDTPKLLGERYQTVSLKIS